MLKQEIETKMPTPHPFDEDETERLREMIAAEWMPPNKDEVIRNAEASQSETFGVIIDFASLFIDECKDEFVSVGRDSGEKAPSHEKIYAYLSSVGPIRSLFQSTQMADMDVNEPWFAWTFAKASIAMAFEFRRAGLSGKPCFSPKSQHRWENKALDLQYLMYLHFAQAIASNETSGEMKSFFTWIWGCSRKFYCKQDLENLC